MKMLDMVARVVRCRVLALEARRERGSVMDVLPAGMVWVVVVLVAEVCRVSFVAVEHDFEKAIVTL